LFLARSAPDRDGIIRGEPWSNWSPCAEDIVSARRLDVGLRAKPGTAASEEVHSIIQIDEDGVLSFAEQGHDDDFHVISSLRAETGPVHIIALFGSVKAGKSTLLTALSCAFAHSEGSHEDTIPVHFKPWEDHKTFGLWASPPFEYKGRKFVLIDLEGLGDVSSGDLGLDIEDPRKREHGLVKIIAMLSEVVSVFVYVSGEQEMKTSDYNEISKAMKVTRRNLIYKDDVEASMSKHSSMDHPALLISRRFRSLKDIRRDYLLQDRFDVDNASLSDISVSDFERHMGAQSEFRQIMLENFRSISVSKDGRTAPIKNAPVVGMPNGDKEEYNWAEDLWLADDDSSGRTQHCQHYLDMYRPEYRCNEQLSGAPPRPALYKMFVDHMADDIYDISSVRYLKDQSGESPVTGRKFIEYLQTAVQEMNKIRPLPETMLWRAVIEESCAEKLGRLVDAKLGNNTDGCSEVEVDKGTCGGALAKIGRRMQRRRRHFTLDGEPSWRRVLRYGGDLPQWIQKVWDSAMKEWIKEKAMIFESIGVHGDFSSVRARCEMAADQTAEQYVHIKNGFFFEAEKFEMQVKLENQVQWEQHKWIMLMYFVAGVLVLIAILNICGKMHGAMHCLSVCCQFCCGGRNARAVKEAQPREGVELTQHVRRVGANA